jgi:glutamine synthetase
MISDEERSKLGITQKLPEDVQGALESLRQSTLLRRAFGSTLLDAYCMNIDAYADLLNRVCVVGGEKAQLQYVLDRF